MPDDDSKLSQSDDRAHGAARDPDSDADTASVSDARTASGSDADRDGPASDDGGDANDGDDGGDGDAGSDVTDPASALTDPSESVTDPAESVPSPEAPDVGVDGPDLPSPEEVPEGLRAEFWEIVLAFNVGLFALALGAMLVAFDGRATLGGVALGVGVLALAYGFWQYRTREHAP